MKPFPAQCPSLPRRIIPVQSPRRAPLIFILKEWLNINGNGSKPPSVPAPESPLPNGSLKPLMKRPRNRTNPVQAEPPINFLARHVRFLILASPFRCGAGGGGMRHHPAFDSGPIRHRLSHPRRWHWTGQSGRHRADSAHDFHGLGGQEILSTRGSCRCYRTT